MIYSVYAAALESVNRDAQAWAQEGTVANYIPALAQVLLGQFAVSMQCVGVNADPHPENRHIAAGAANARFSIQSISKVFTMALAMRLVGPSLWERVGREPSGSAFNSLIQLEYEHGIPRNPFINPGALVVADALVSHTPDPKQSIIEFVRELSGSPDIVFDEAVAASERDWGFRNAAHANFLKSFGNLHNPVETVLDVYFHQCSLAMSCSELATAMSFLANNGVVPHSGVTALNPEQTRRLNALMLTCGTYDEAGEFAFQVGLPAKSGVGGGIVAVAPGRASLAVWSPGLGPSGNSVAGTRALCWLSRELGLSVF